jgi:hypothetical protein
MADVGALIGAGFHLAPELIGIGKLEAAGSDIAVLYPIAQNMPKVTTKAIVALLTDPHSDKTQAAINDVISIGRALIAKNPANGAAIEALLAALGIPTQ